MSTVTAIIDNLLKMKIRRGKVMLGDNPSATKLYFILLQQIVLRLNNFVSTYPGTRPVVCVNKPCFAMVTQLLLQRCAPKDLFGSPLPEGVCGCAFFHENAEVEAMNELLDGELIGGRVEKLVELFGELCDLKFETKDSSMACTVYNIAKGGFEKESIFLPCPAFGDPSDHPAGASSGHVTMTRPGVSAHRHGAAPTMEGHSAPPARPRVQAPLAEPAAFAPRQGNARAAPTKPWTTVIAERDDNVISLEESARKSREHVARLQELLNAEKARQANFEREQRLAQQKAKDDKVASELEREIAKLRLDNERLRKQLPMMDDPPVITARPPRYAPPIKMVCPKGTHPAGAAKSAPTPAEPPKTPASIIEIVTAPENVGTPEVKTGGSAEASVPADANDAAKLGGDGVHEE